MQWSFLIKRGTEKYGPYTAEEARLYLLSGNIVATDLAWNEEKEAWVPLMEMLEAQEPPPAPPRPPRERHAAVLVVMALVWWFVFVFCFFAAASFFAGVVVTFMDVKDPRTAGEVIGRIATLPIILGSLGLAVWLTVIGKLPGTRK